MFISGILACKHRLTLEWLSNEKMTFLDDKRIRQLNQHLPEFTRKVDPIELLPYLQCLTQSSREEIENRQRQNSKSQAAMKLYDHLIRMDNWWPQLLVALRHTNLYQLADKLEEIDEDGRPRVEHTRRKTPPPKARLYSGDTKYKDLPARVSSILKILDSQDVENNWEAMAAHLKYTIEEVTRMKCNQNEASCTKKLFEDWSQREESTLHNLVIALNELERFDLLEQIQKVTGYRLPKIKKEHMDADEHGCDVILSTGMLNRKSKDTSLKDIVQESTVSPSELDPLTSDNETNEAHSLSNKHVGPHNEPLRLPDHERTLFGGKSE
ncbi:uncharacterized protein LOC117340036 [Pecten maximus]|uniref:uncharacterized protein LOC117340036 n=1 Tax=Pecten maximus TaxID=6579 RepID=UPI001458BC49|nr:uncharacterized protein LOC117340036 [Pecten maximus]